MVSGHFQPHHPNVHGRLDNIERHRSIGNDVVCKPAESDGCFRPFAEVALIANAVHLRDGRQTGLGARMRGTDMMPSHKSGPHLTLVTLMMVGFPVNAEVSSAAGNTPRATQSSTAISNTPEAASSFVPVDFNAPTLVETGDFKIVPLGPDLVKVDFDAYMSSIEHLQKTFTRSADWPHEGISDADAMRDMQAEQARFRKRASFAYAVLTKDGRRERGCVYVYPSTVAGFDAVVRLWVTKAEFDAGFDAELFAWVTTWMRRDWPFAKIAYPGRSIAWEEWESVVAASKALNAAMQQ